MRFAGEFAALGTALCWATGSNLFAAAGRRMGSGVLNRLRITVACVFLGTALLVLRGSPWPFWAEPRDVGLLALSGVVGFVFGDTYYFRSLVILGPGRATLLAALTPLFTALFAWPILGEIPGPLATAGMGLILGGVFLVLQARPETRVVHAEGSAAAGVVAGILASIGGAGGYILSKMALHGGLDALSATVVRIAAAAVGVWTLGLIRGSAARSFGAMRDRRAMAFMVGGAFMGPFLGVTLSLVALQYIETGVAASITAVFPVFALLIAARFHGETITLRTVLGTLVAVGGVAVLFLR